MLGFSCHPPPLFGLLEFYGITVKSVESRPAARGGEEFCEIIFEVL